MAYEKADFYAAYMGYAVDPENNRRFARFKDAETFGDETVTCILHYHPLRLKQTKAIMAQRIVDHFEANLVPLAAADRIVIIGGAFGWTGEALEDLIPNLEVVSVDLSQYVQDTKNSSPDDELIEAIEAEGRTHTDGGIGQFLYEKFSDPNPRSRNGAKVLQEDLVSVQSRNAVRKALKNADPTRVITEEVWQILTQEEKDRYTAAAQNWGVTLTHIIDDVIVDGAA